MALEDGEYRISESKSVIGYLKTKLTNQKQTKKMTQDHKTSSAILAKEDGFDSVALSLGPFGLRSV